jgi:hypothetical protein
MVAVVLHPEQTLEPLDLITIASRGCLISRCRAMSNSSASFCDGERQVQKFNLTERRLTQETWDCEAADYKVKRLVPFLTGLLTPLEIILRLK